VTPRARSDRDLDDIGAQGSQWTVRPGARSGCTRGIRTDALKASSRTLPVARAVRIHSELELSATAPHCGEPSRSACSLGPLRTPRPNVGPARHALDSNRLHAESPLRHGAEQIGSVGEFRLWVGWRRRPVVAQREEASMSACHGRGRRTRALALCRPGSDRAYRGVEPRLEPRTLPGVALVLSISEPAIPTPVVARGRGRRRTFAEQAERGCFFCW